MNESDKNELTEYWMDKTNALNGIADNFFRDAQDQAYELGLKRGQREMTVLAKRMKTANAENDQKEWLALHDAIYKLADA